MWDLGDVIKCRVEKTGYIVKYDECCAFIIPLKIIGFYKKYCILHLPDKVLPTWTGSLLTYPKSLCNVDSERYRNERVYLLSEECINTYSSTSKV